jgi:hypothetical protein
MEGPNREPADVTAVFRRKRDGYRIAIDIIGPRKDALRVAIGEAVLRLVLAANYGSNLEDFVPKSSRELDGPDCMIKWERPTAGRSHTG